jgi:hypothetical protein
MAALPHAEPVRVRTFAPDQHQQERSPYAALNTCEIKA